LIGDGDYLLISGNGNDTCWIRVRFGFLPRVTEELFVDVSDLYYPPLKGSDYPTSTGGSKDRLHRGRTGTGLPKETNPHGLTSEDVIGYGSDVTVHQKRMHSNCIVSEDWTESGSSDTLKPYINNMYISIKSLPLHDRYYIQGKEFDEILSSNIKMTGSGTRYVGIDTNKNLVASSSPLDENYVTLCSVFVSGGFLADFVDMRVFGSQGEVNFQEKAVTRKKLDDESLKKRHLWEGQDNSSVEGLVDGGVADDLHRHLDYVEIWKGRYYLKTLLSSPIAPTPDNMLTGDYNGTQWVGAEGPGADVLGGLIESAPQNVPRPTSFKSPGQVESLEQRLSCSARVTQTGVDSVQESIDYLATLMKGLRDREFPIAQEVMDTSGRMTNLQVVPLPDNHNNGGYWLDGEAVTQDQATWIVDPAIFVGHRLVFIFLGYICVPP